MPTPTTTASRTAPTRSRRTGSSPEVDGGPVPRGDERRTDGWRRLAALVLVAGALYGNALSNGLVWDDRLTAVEPAAALAGRTGAFYRPLVMLSFALDRALWGSWTVGYHLTNVVAHVGVAWLLGALVSAIGLGAGAALAAALLFVAHPVQTEAVTYVSGRTDVLCALLVLVALLSWRRARRTADGFAVASAAALLAALLCKEAAVLVPVALLVPGAHPAARAPRPLLPLAAAAAWLVAWTATGPTVVHAGGLATRLPAIAVAALEYARLLVWPADLHLERFVAVPGRSLGAAVGAWAAVGGLGAGLVGLARRVRGGGFLLALAACAWAPVSNVVPVHPAIADRALFAAEHFLYLPLVGLVPLVVGAVATLRLGRLAPALLVALLVPWGAVVVDRNRDWRDEATLFRHTVAHDPPVARVWFNLANLALAAGRLDEAVRLYRAALAREPRDADARLNLGIALQRQGRVADAEVQYRAAVAANPRLVAAARGLAGLLLARGAVAEAERVLEAAGVIPGPAAR